MKNINKKRLKIWFKRSSVNLLPADKLHLYISIRPAGTILRRQELKHHYTPEQIAYGLY